MTIVYTDEALADLLDALKYVRERNPVAARTLDADISTCIDRLARGEFDGPQSVLHSGSVVRSWAVQRFRIYYQRHADEFLVVRIYHQARRPIAR